MALHGMVWNKMGWDVCLSVCMYVYLYPGTIKLSDAKVKRQGYKLALFGGGGVHFVSTLNFYTLF